MRNNHWPSFSFRRRRSPALYLFALCLLLVSSACQSQKGGESAESRGVIVINAPAAGEVRRVLVSEGMTVNEGAPIVEIAVRTEVQGTPQPQAEEDPRARAARNMQAAQSEVEAARADVVRKEVEVQRLTGLVATGDAPQAQLDGARAEFERAQRRLQQAQSAEQNSQAGIATAQQSSPGTQAPPARTFSEQIVTAQATSAGRVSVINAKVGDRVTSGQPLATLRAEEP
ncbi:MAG TPA: hypothetical protein VJT09_12725 [Pyrinomonadaceae bacterium]|nr:hypothetical protein [Pyrinomonadaceae bacterium]